MISFIPVQHRTCTSSLNIYEISVAFSEPTQDVSQLREIGLADMNLVLIKIYLTTNMF